MSATHYTINKVDGTFVAGRRSPRLAAKKGAATVSFVPRVERFSAGAETAGPVGQRRTSPRLAPMYAAKAAAARRQAEAFRLVEEVLAFAARRGVAAPSGAPAPAPAPAPARRTSPRLVAYNAARAAKEARRKEVLTAMQQAEPKGFTIFYDPRFGRHVTCTCGDCFDNLRLLATRTASELLTLVDAVMETPSESPQRLEGVARIMARMLDNPDVPLLLMLRPRVAEIMRKKTEEMLRDPLAVPSLRVLCQNVLDRFWPAK
jgi:hypothetical protein